MAEQRYQAVLAVIAQGEPVQAVAEQWGSRQTAHSWLGRPTCETRDWIPHDSTRGRRVAPRRIGPAAAKVLPRGLESIYRTMASKSLRGRPAVARFLMRMTWDVPRASVCCQTMSRFLLFAA